eukprot:6214458-Pleurochrysis_carterae.AAC.4
MFVLLGRVYRPAGGGLMPPSAEEKLGGTPSVLSAPPHLGRQIFLYEGSMPRRGAYCINIRLVRWRAKRTA